MWLGLVWARDTIMSCVAHCPIRTATTDIGSSCACSGATNGRFWSHCGKCISQSKVVPVSHLKPIIPLFHTVVTVMAKWLYIQAMAI